MSTERLLKHLEQIAEAPNAVPRLRRFILDLAVRGKLVEQSPKEESPHHLLEQLEKNKRKTDSTMVRKSLSIPPVQSDDLWEVPESWAFVQVGKLPSTDGLFVDGDWIESKDQDPNGDIRLIQLADIGVGIFRNRSNKFLTSKTAERLNCTYLHEGDILIARMPDPIGRACVFPGDTRYCVTAVDVAILRPTIEGISLKFIVHAINSSLFSGNTIKYTAGTTRNRISRGNLANLPLPFPPLAEQHRIVAKVDELMALCDELEAAQIKREKRRDRLVAAILHGLNNGEADSEVNEKFPFEESARFYFNYLPRLTTRPEHIQQLRQTILNLAVRGKLVPQDLKAEPASEMLARVREWRAEAMRKKLIRDPRKPLKTIALNESPYKLPDGWAWARLGEVIYIQSGDGLTAENMKGGNIPVYGGNGINGYHDTFNIEEPTIVIGRVGFYCGSIHVTPAKAWVTDNAFITKYCSQEIFQDFLVLLLKGTNLKENENATAQPVISGSKIYPIVVGIPPFAEQHQIVAKVAELMKLCEELEARISETTTIHRQFLEATLQEAINTPGELKQEAYQ